MRAMSVLRSLARDAIDLVFAPSCAWCAADLEERVQALVCVDCRRKLAAASASRCARCGIELPAAATGVPCRTCDGQKLWFDGVAALGSYRTELREAVLATKHRSHEPLAIALAELLSIERRAELAAWKADCVMPVPMHWRRRLERGTNAPEMAAAVLARRLALRHVRAVVKHVNTPTQGTLGPRERRANVRGAFRMRFGRKLPRARVLLVDDVMTTGATANEVARVLKKAGAAAVFVAVVARTPPG